MRDSGIRAEQARTLGIDVVHGNTLETQCRVDGLSFVYLNPPYDFGVSKTDNQRMELVFLRHTGRWVMPGGTLILIVPEARSRLPDLRSSASPRDLLLVALLVPADSGLCRLPHVIKFQASLVVTNTGKITTYLSLF
jgi:hypothetical protein